MPLGRRPEIPKFPKPAADPTGEKEGKEASIVPGNQVAFEGRESPAEVNRVEEKNESQPHRAEKKGAERPRQNDRDDHKNGAGTHEHVLGGTREADRAGGSTPPSEGSDEIGG